MTESDPEPDIGAYNQQSAGCKIAFPLLTDPCQFDMIVQDKKVKRGKLTSILTRAIGRPSLSE
jgi:hypothetical protein